MYNIIADVRHIDNILNYYLEFVKTVNYHLVGGSSVEQENKLTLTVEEAAAVLNISRSLAYEACRQGKIPTLRIGRRLLVSRRALDALLSQPAGSTVIDTKK